MQNNKKCVICDFDKDISEYYKATGNLDGLNKACKKCCLARTKKYRDSHKKEIAEYRVAYKEINRDAILESDRLYRLANKEKISKASQKYEKDNKDKINERKRESYPKRKEAKAMYALLNKERLKEYRKNYYQENKDDIDKKNSAYRIKNLAQYNARNAKRRAAKLQRTPEWADLNAIKDVYLEAQYFQMEVDHIIPLQGKLVSGLHVWDNLQLLTKSENCSKYNTFQG